jgi:hypothetical protein
VTAIVRRAPFESAAIRPDGAAARSDVNVRRAMFRPQMQFPLAAPTCGSAEQRHGAGGIRRERLRASANTRSPNRARSTRRFERAGSPPPVIATLSTVGS